MTRGWLKDNRKRKKHNDCIRMRKHILRGPFQVWSRNVCIWIRGWWENFCASDSRTLSFIYSGTGRATCPWETHRIRRRICGSVCSDILVARMAPDSTSGLIGLGEALYVCLSTDSAIHCTWILEALNWRRSCKISRSVYCYWWTF